MYHAHRLISYSFRDKYLGDNSDEGSLKTYCSLISDRTTLGFQQVCCSCQSCHFPECWLLKVGIILLPLISTENLVELHISEELADMWTDKNNPL